jgi:hypothetical protein
MGPDAAQGAAHGFLHKLGSEGLRAQVILLFFCVGAQKKGISLLQMILICINILPTG